jgi:hypothetical protein
MFRLGQILSFSQDKGVAVRSPHNVPLILLSLQRDAPGLSILPNSAFHPILNVSAPQLRLPAREANMMPQKTIEAHR